MLQCIVIESTCSVIGIKTCSSQIKSHKDSYIGCHSDLVNRYPFIVVTLPSLFPLSCLITDLSQD
jgi:hypothetical protein